MKAKDYTGMRFGMLVALKRKRENNRTYYLCKCDCGNSKWIRDNALKKAYSCGCIRDKKIKENAKKMINAHLDKNIIDGTNLAIISSSTPKSNNKSGVTGVRWDKDREKWLASLKFKGKYYYLGRYENKEDAIKARKEAENKIFKPFLESLKEE